MENKDYAPLVDFGNPEDKSKNIIKVIGVGGGGCNAVRNMYQEGIVNVTFAVCNTDSQSLAKSPVPVKIQLGKSGLGAGANPEKGREEAQQNIEDIKRLLDDGTQMVFVTAGMGGGTGTGAAPIIAGIAKEKGILTIGIVTIPFYFEKKRKIIKALKGVEEMRKNVDALLIINNERLCDVFSDTQVTIKEAFHRADDILCNATKSISELVTVEGNINLDFRDVETTMRGGGGAIMAMGRAKGEHRVEKAIIDALDSPLLYGSDISKAKKILFNIYTGDKGPLFVHEMQEIDAFMDSLDPNIEVIWGVSDDNSLGEDAKVTILATGLDDKILDEEQYMYNGKEDEKSYDAIIKRLYFQKVPFTADSDSTSVAEMHNNSVAETSNLSAAAHNISATAETVSSIGDAPASPTSTGIPDDMDNNDSNKEHDDIIFTVNVGGEDNAEVINGYEKRQEEQGLGQGQGQNLGNELRQEEEQEPYPTSGQGAKSQAEQVADTEDNSVTTQQNIAQDIPSNHVDEQLQHQQYPTNNEQPTMPSQTNAPSSITKEEEKHKAPRPLTFVEKVKARMAKFAYDVMDDDKKE